MLVAERRDERRALRIARELGLVILAGLFEHGGGIDGAAVATIRADNFTSACGATSLLTSVLSLRKRLSSLMAPPASPVAAMQRGSVHHGLGKSRMLGVLLEELVVRFAVL